MRRRNYFIVLTVLCALNCFEAKKQLTYDYLGTVIAKNRISDDGYSKWSISGDLTVQQFDDHQIFKLDKLKTTIFNGLKTAEEPKRKEPLADIEDITKPFAVYYHSTEDVDITVDPKESFWSMNMKKAIASVFNVDTTAKDGFNGVEQTLYGRCPVNYEIELSSSNSTIINKIIDHKNCDYSQISSWKNVNEVNLNIEHISTIIETKRIYVLHVNSDDLDYIRSESNVTYQNTPAVRTTHHLEQQQTYTLKNTVVEFEPLKVPASATEKETLFWNTEQDKDKSDASEEQLIKDYKKYVEAFRAQFQKRPLENKNIASPNLIDDMSSALSNLDMGGITRLTHDLISNGELEDQYILLSLLPYIGTEHTTELIKQFVKNDNINDLLLIKLLAIFPTYVNNPNQRILNKFKFLMNLEEVVNNTQVRYAGILSYASLMAETFSRGDFDQEILFKTIGQYQKRLTNSEHYEEKLTYLLGLINLASCMDGNLILEIITDSDLDDNLRPLALLSFKNYLSNPTDKNVFKKIWPLVQNASENFEVRVASLDLLLSSNLTEEQFNTILNTYDKKPANSFEEHLGNYLFSTIQSLEKSDSSLDYIANFAKARLQKGSIPSYTRSWTTGNYRLGFYDDQTLYGASLQTSLIGSPISNGLNVIHVYFNRFEMSLALDSYTVYLKLGGVIDSMFLEGLLNSRTDNTPISALLDLITKYNYKIKSGEDVHIDVALFSKKRAVFGIHINQNNIDSYTDNPLFLDLIKLMIYYQSVSLPLMSYTRFPSDMGTTIGITEDIEQVVYQQTDNMEQITKDDIKVKDMTYHYKSSYEAETTLKCHNPLAKGNVLVVKQYAEEKAFDFPFRFNTRSYQLLWKGQKDIFNLVSDRNIFTTVDKKENLQHYCPDCDKYYAVPLGTDIDTSVYVHALGFKFDFKSSNNSEHQVNLDKDYQRTDGRHVLETSYHSNGFVFPPSKPIMFIWNWVYYHDNKMELNSISLKTGPAYDQEYRTVLEFGLTDKANIKDNNPLDAAKLGAYFVWSNPDAEGLILSGFNTSFKMQRTPQSSNDQTEPYVEHNYAFDVNIYNGDSNFTRLCINREMLYPSRRSDKLSLKPVKPAKGKLTIALGAVKNFNERPDKYITFTELYTATEIQNKKAEEMNEYKKCKEDSAGFKYVPPTPECVAAHKALSKYDFYGIYADLEHADVFEQHKKYMEQTELGYKVLEYTHINDALLNVTMDDEVRARYIAIPDSNFVENAVFYDFLSADPTAVAYGDYDLYIGFAKTCVITPNTIETFYGVREASFTNKQEEIVAYVECSNTTQSGLTVQRLNNKAVGFKMWSGSNLVTVTTENEKLCVTFNGKQISQTLKTQDEELKVHFLEHDVIYVVDTIVEVYYTKEYISIKAMAIYDKFTCGRCSYVEKK